MLKRLTKLTVSLAMKQGGFLAGSLQLVSVATESESAMSTGRVMLVDQLISINIEVGVAKWAWLAASLVVTWLSYTLSG